MNSCMHVRFFYIYKINALHAELLLMDRPGAALDRRTCHLAKIILRK